MTGFLAGLFSGWRSAAPRNEGIDALAERDYPRAETHLRKALELSPDDETALYNLGVALHGQRRYPEAAETLERAVAGAAPVNPAPLIALGMVRYETGDFERARVALRDALRIDVKHPAAHYYLGLILLKEGRVDEATEEFEEVIAERPTFVQARMLALGEGFLNAQKLAAASLRGPGSAGQATAPDPTAKPNASAPDRIEPDQERL